MNKKLKCLLLDDELPGLTYLKMLCEQSPELEVVKAFNNPKLFMDEAPALDFDLCILDVEMPGINGLQVANLLNGKPVIFTTAYKEYAAEAFDIDAVDYIQKPIQKDRFRQAILKAVKRINPSNAPKNFMQLNTDLGKALVYFEQLGFISTSEKDSRDKIAYLKDQSTLFVKNISFENLLKMLPKQQFCRINKKEIVSLSVVKVFSFDEIITTLTTASGKPIVLTLGETFRSEFLPKS